MVAAAAVVAWPSAVGLQTPRPSLVGADESATTRVREKRAYSSTDRRVETQASTVRIDAKAPSLTPTARAATPKPRAIDDQPQGRQQPRHRLSGPARRALPVRKVSRDRSALSWKAVRGASYYNVIVWRKGRRVLDLWPSVNRTLLPRSWTSKGVSRTLSPGRYLWFVYPGFGPRAEARYGEPVQSGVLVIDGK